MAKSKKSEPFGMKWLPAGKPKPMVDFTKGLPKKPVVPKAAIGVRPPRRKPILKVTGTGKPGGKISVRLPIMERPSAAVRKIKDVVSRIARGPKPIGVRPDLLAERAKGKRPARKRWTRTLKDRGQATPVSEARLPNGIEAFIDTDDATRGIYRLMRATERLPDHKEDENHTCVHPRNASSWVACIGLAVLNDGRLGLYAQFWNGGEIAYVWPDDDTVIWFYNDWKAARSKGKYIRGREGPSMLWSQPYVRLS